VTIILSSLYGERPQSGSTAMSSTHAPAKSEGIGDCRRDGAGVERRAYRSVGGMMEHIFDDTYTGPRSSTGVPTGRRSMAERRTA
jgi:hypothetical protein